MLKRPSRNDNAVLLINILLDFVYWTKLSTFYFSSKAIKRILCASIPHDVPKTHSCHKMLYHQGCTAVADSDTTNLPGRLSPVAARRHSIFGHINRLPDAHLHIWSWSLPWHQVWRHTTPWLEPLCWKAKDYVVKPDCAGLTAVDAWSVAEDRPTWRALRPTASYVQQWMTEWFALATAVVKTVWASPVARWHHCHGVNGLPVI